MRKILLGLVLLAILTPLLIPIIASAQIVAPECCKLRRDFKEIDEKCIKDKWVGPTDGVCPKAPGGRPEYTTDNWGMCCFFNTIYIVTDWIFTIFIALAVIMTLLGAYTLITAAGATEAITKGKNYILWALIGLIIAFLAKAIPAVAKALMGI